ncbi:RTA1 like protein-domain-containing protein [Aspergillus floccosus]
MAKLEPYVGDYYLWQYIPSKPASVIFLLLFLGATTFHFWKAWRIRARFCIPFCFGGLFEVIGYGARAACTDRTGQLMPYVVQSLFILLAPVLFAASVYMILSRLICRVGAEQHALIRVNWMTKVFLAGDILSFLIQGNGAGLMVMDGMANMAKGIVIGGLMVQVVVFGLFMVTSVVFEVRMQRKPTSHDLDWRQHLYPLYAVSALIMVRSVFRVIEYAMGQEGYLLAHEWPMYVFDTVLMLAVMMIWGYRHPGGIQQDTYGEQLLPFPSLASDHRM